MAHPPGTWGRRLKSLEKAATAMLLFSFTFSPFFASAQTSTPDQSTPANQSSAPSTDSNTNTFILPSPDIQSPSTPTPPDQSTDQTATTDAAPAPDAATPDASAPQTLNTLSAPGSGAVSPDLTRKALNPNFYSETDPVTGSLVSTYPIKVPPGRNGLQPSIDLTYSSQPGSQTNVLGYQWDPGIPYIQRINKKGTGALYSQDYYYSTLDGELYVISTSTGTYGAKTENGGFNQYQKSGSASTTSWTITTKDGTTYTFGTSTASTRNGVLTITTTTTIKTTTYRR